MPYVNVASEKIFYSCSSFGQSRVILAIHGSGGDHTNWPENLKNLPEAAVYTLDLPGHGQSSGEGRDSVNAYADFIDAFVTKLNLDNVTLIGHSLGGAIVQILAVRAPRWLTGIVLAGTGARLKVEPDILEGLLANFEATIDVVCQWVFGPTASEQLMNACRQVMLNTLPAVILGDYSACNQFDIMETLNKIDLPTLVVSGTADKLTPPKYGEYLCEHIPGANHSIIIDAGHMMALEKPEELTKIIADFLGTPTDSG
jgi:pimeloyl-ACP methyl ester carboxylesterase